jgi:metalloendopeptidase OMA1, mitochondrial
MCFYAGMKTIRGVVVGWIVVVTLLVAACSTVPVTGRKQMLLVSGEQELQLGLTSFDQMKQEVPVSKDARANALVQAVGRRIAAVASKDLPNAQWEFVVFDSPEANAFCLPGGKVGVYTGILAITKDEAGLATVIGHEVAHAAAHHGAERMSEAMVMQTGGQVVTGLASSDPRMQALISTVYGAGSTLGRTLPHSRKQESEADHIGLIYMAQAGYNPQEAVNFWQRFSAYNKEKGSGGTPWFLSTHPVDTKRIAALQAEMPEAMKYYRGPGVVAPTPVAPSAPANPSSSAAPVPSSIIGRPR